MAPHKGHEEYKGHEEHKEHEEHKGHDSTICTRNTPLQFCSIYSTSSVAVVAGLHCSFYDSFASSFSISQHNQNNAYQQLGLPGVQMNVEGNPFQNNLGVNVFNSGNSNQFQLYNNHYHRPQHLSASPNSLMVSQNYSTKAYHPNLTA